MENPTAFDLNRAIKRWREDLAKCSSLRGETLDELESHLKDSVAILMDKGLSEEEAFLIAVRRCGTRKQLQVEFSKHGLLQRGVLETWFFRVAWILVGFLALVNGYSFVQGKPRAWEGAAFPLHLGLPTIVLLVLALTGLNVLLLCRVREARNRNPLMIVLHCCIMAGFAASLILGCRATFEILYAALLSRDAVSPYVTAQTLSGIWLSYGFIVSQILILVLLLARWVAPLFSGARRALHGRSQEAFVER